MAKIIKLLEKLKKYPVFNLNKFAAAADCKLGYAKLYLYRLKKAGYIFKIERGKYTTYDSAFLISTNILWPSYISFWSALRYHNLTEQLPQDIWVVIAQRKKNKIIKFSYNQAIRFVKVPPKYFFGFEKINYDGFDIFIAEKEKAIVDCILLKKVSLSEMYEVIKNNRKRLKLNKIAKYALKTKNSEAIKRIGFILDKIGYDCYNILSRQINMRIIPLSYNLPSNGRTNKKWKIIENMKV